MTFLSQFFFFFVPAHGLQTLMDLEEGEKQCASWRDLRTGRRHGIIF